jgi:flagellar basal body-associated protein FliL
VKKFLILLILMLLIGSGGGAYYYFFVLSAEDGMTEEAPPPPPDVRFVEMDALKIPVMRNGVVVNYVVLTVSLETIGPEHEERVQEYMPRLRNAFLTDLLGYFATVPVDDRIMVQAIKRRLNILSGRVVGEGVVNDVLIQNALKQKS